MLYKFGGIYLDLDIMTLNSLAHYKNFVTSEPPDIVCGGAISFRRNNIK